MATFARCSRVWHHLLASPPCARALCHYQLLGVKPDASSAEIKVMHFCTAALAPSRHGLDHSAGMLAQAAFYKRAKAVHPDVARHANPGDNPEVHNISAACREGLRT